MSSVANPVAIRVGTSDCSQCKKKRVCYLEAGCGSKARCNSCMQSTPPACYVPPTLPSVQKKLVTDTMIDSIPNESFRPFVGIAHCDRSFCTNKAIFIHIEKEHKNNKSNNNTSTSEIDTLKERIKALEQEVESLKNPPPKLITLNTFIKKRMGDDVANEIFPEYNKKIKQTERKEEPLDFDKILIVNCDTDQHKLSKLANTMYMCSGRKFTRYAEHIVKNNTTVVMEFENKKEAEIVKELVEGCIPLGVCSMYEEDILRKAQLEFKENPFLKEQLQFEKEHEASCQCCN